MITGSICCFQIKNLYQKASPIQNMRRGLGRVQWTCQEYQPQKKKNYALDTMIELRDRDKPKILYTSLYEGGAAYIVI